ncbi:hypothetical protein [Sphingosinicella sp. CPCC 101087]|nr:hypothetical protein [Sphingosinicella sp. CPCC 101087]
MMVERAPLPLATVPFDRPSMVRPGEAERPIGTDESLPGEP